MGDGGSCKDEKDDMRTWKFGYCIELPDTRTCTCTRRSDMKLEMKERDREREERENGRAS